MLNVTPCKVYLMSKIFKLAFRPLKEEDAAIKWLYCFIRRHRRHHRRHRLHRRRGRRHHRRHRLHRHLRRRRRHHRRHRRRLYCHHRRFKLELKMLWSDFNVGALPSSTVNKKNTPRQNLTIAKIFLDLRLQTKISQSYHHILNSLHTHWKRSNKGESNVLSLLMPCLS